jgi:hypothetical protein
VTGTHAASPRDAGVTSSGKARTAWLVIGSVVTVAALLGGVSNIVGLLAHEMETRIVTVPAADIAVLEVHSDAGSVTVRAADVTEITVRARIGHGLRRSGSSVEVVDDRLVVRGSCPVFGSQWCDVRYTIDVPAGIDVVVRADNDDVRVSGVTGVLDLHSGNGSVRADDVGGSLTMSSDNGSIRGTGVVADTVDARTDNGDVAIEMRVAPRMLNARSDNGDVEVVVPDDAATYAVDISSGNGSVDSALRTDPASERRVTISSDNGNVSASYG